MAESSVATAGYAPRAVRIAPLRVFLVEDSPVLRDLIVEDLSTIPGVTLGGVAETERDAHAKLMDDDFDVIVFDIQLREGNGINLLRTLARQSLQRDAVKVVLSNHVGGTYRRLCDQYDVQYFFDKTAEFSRLHLLLENLSAGN